jgi:hypothetical protein
MIPLKFEISLLKSYNLVSLDESLLCLELELLDSGVLLLHSSGSLAEVPAGCALKQQALTS